MAVVRKIIKGAIAGAAVGLIAPIALSVFNEVIWSAKSGESVGNAHICFAQRHFYLFKGEIKHARGCQNKILANTPGILIMSVLGGSLLSAISLAGLNQAKPVNNKSKTKSVQETSEDYQRASAKGQKIEQESKGMASHAFSVPNDFDWKGIGKMSAIAGGVAILGFATVKTLENSPGAWTSNQYEGGNGNTNILSGLLGKSQDYCSKSTNGYTICIKKENIYCKDDGDVSNPWFLCSASGVSKDLTGKEEHFHSEEFCKMDGNDRDFACTSARHFGLI